MRRRHPVVVGGALEAVARARRCGSPTASPGWSPRRRSARRWHRAERAARPRSAASAWPGSPRSTACSSAHRRAGPAGQLLVRRAALRRHRRRAGLALPARAGGATCRPAGPWCSPPCSALVAYLLLPTAPPRFVPGYVDVLQPHAAARLVVRRRLGAARARRADQRARGVPVAARRAGRCGWRSSPQRHATRSLVRAARLGVRAGTAVVVVGTGNHWVLDVLAGWVVVLLAWCWSTGTRDGGRGSGAREPRERLADHRRIGSRPHRRQAGLEEAAVPGRGQPRVQHRHDAAVAGGADQPARRPGPAAARRGWRRPA